MAVPGTSAFGNYMPAHAGMAGQQHQQSDYSMPQGNAHGGAAYGSGGDFNQIQNRILQMVRQLGQSNEGVNIPFLCQTLAPEGLNEMTIR